MRADSKKKQGDLIYREILEKIIVGEFQPGQRLVEEEMARHFHVSRTPIREILVMLERDGLVQRRRNRGTHVVSFTADDVEQIYAIRNALECLGVRCAAPNLRLDDLLSFEDRLISLLGPKGPKWIQEQAELDLQFHDFIISRSGSRHLVDFLNGLSVLIHSLRLISNSNDEHATLAAQEHLAIVRALLRRDVGLAERLLAEHISAAGRRVIESSFIRSMSLAKIPSS